MSDSSGKVKVCVIWEYEVVCVNGPSNRINIIEANFDFSVWNVVLLENFVHQDDNAINPCQFAAKRTLVLRVLWNHIHPHNATRRILTF